MKGGPIKCLVQTRSIELSFLADESSVRRVVVIAIVIAVLGIIAAVNNRLMVRIWIGGWIIATAATANDMVVVWIRRIGMRIWWRVMGLTVTVTDDDDNLGLSSTRHSNHGGGDQHRSREYSHNCVSHWIRLLLQPHIGMQSQNEGNVRLRFISVH